MQRFPNILFITAGRRLLWFCLFYRNDGRPRLHIPHQSSSQLTYGVLPTHPRKF